MSELDKSHPLRRRYYRRVRNAMVLAVAAHAGLFLVGPRYRPDPPIMKADPIHLLPAGVSLQSVGSEPAAAATSAGAVATPPALVAAPEREIRPEQLLDPESAGEPSMGEGGASGGSSERNAPPVYYGYDTPPRALKTLEPEYPEVAKNAGLEGTVVINLNLDERGRILRAWVASSNASDILVSAALDAAYQFEFTPGLLRGSPIRSTVAIPIRFSLKKTTYQLGG